MEGSRVHDEPACKAAVFDIFPMDVHAVFGREASDRMGKGKASASTTDDFEGQGHVNGVHGSNGAGSVPMMTTLEAAKRLGITPRHFGRLRAATPVPGAVMVDGAWAFPVASIDAMADRAGDRGEEDGTHEEALAQLTREVSKAGAAVFATCQTVLAASAEILKTAGGQMSAENKRMGEAMNDTFKLQLELFGLLKDLVVGQGQMEAEALKSAADQTIRVKRTEVAAGGLRMFAPIVKAGIARALGRPELARDAQGETIAELVSSLQKDPERMMRMQSALDDEQRDAVGGILGWSAAQEQLEANLRKLRATMTPEKMAELSKHLKDRELTALASIFDELAADEAAATAATATKPLKETGT